MISSFSNFLRNTDRSYAPLRRSPIATEDAVPQYLRYGKTPIEARLERDKSAATRSYGERRGPLFAVVSFVRVPIMVISSFTELRPSRDEKAVSVSSFRRTCQECRRCLTGLFHPFADLAFRASTRGVDNRSSREPLSARPNHHLSRSFDFTGICENKVPRATGVFRWYW